ncbi:WhiB family transcriptional regulator [Streptomyces scopuliridis]|uniref:WhiB family transcriptional regulator n=1 Tax=Streptomyces scopuliridis TaxID=452529 RepID=UPI00343FF965
MNHTIVRTSAYGPVSTAAPARSRPACAGTDPELFFAHALSTSQVERAKAVCATCPLMENCLQGALERGEEHGVWGGTDEDDRRRMKRRAAA